MKKIFFILLVNVLLVLFIFVCFEVYLYTKEQGEGVAAPAGLLQPAFMLNVYSMKHEYELLQPNYYELGNSQTEFLFRRPVGLHYKNKPVLLFGCSFAWGARLHEHQTFHYLLSEALERPVYKRAISGWGVQYMLWMLQQEDLYSKVPEPEYVIFVYISSHISRMYKYNWINSLEGAYQFLKYNKGVFGELKEEKKLLFIPASRLYNLYFLKYIAKLQEKNIFNCAFLFLEKHLMQCKKEIAKHWKNTKFVFLIYEADNHFARDKYGIFNENNIQKLKSDDIIVIRTSELTNIPLGQTKYYLDEEDMHPGAEAWKLITPLFAERLKSL